MKTITKKEFEKEVDKDARMLHNKFLRGGTFWPLEICRQEVRKKLINKFKIEK
jgi:hypothetical protein